MLELGGTQKGSISIFETSQNTAQLGLFLVEPSVQGNGYGKQLIETHQYKKITLSTNKELHSARNLYKKKWL
ncbi:GNAT family N-acetyltransferase [Bacillus carboniphilus]|uniref:GNAT family N-acetyltransferase n=1 Tax=Bacillus carboniphilus TaxID=86663 RepID=UPI003531DD7C